MKRHNISRYEIKSELGRGGMATVFHAYDPRFQRDVAIKIIPRELLHDPTFRTRFEREAQTIAVLEHPAIVPVYDFGEEDGQPYLVMRYLPGGSLTDRLEQGRRTFSETAQIIERLASALDEAHRLGIIHRDLKPDNILFDHRNDPYITDFGIAKLSEESNPLTSGSLIIGTPAYMSPEQANGDELDGRSDIYSLGVILFEMLTGKLPYEANTPIGIIMQHITQPIPNILEINPDLPPGCAEVINQAMAKDRDDRFPTAMAMAQALNQAADTTPKAPYTRLPQRARSRTVDLVEERDNSSVTTLDDDTLTCPKCGTANAPRTRFCANCGAQLQVDCPLCFTPNRLDATYCASCGADLQSLRHRQQELQRARKQSLAERDQAYKEKASRQLRTKLEGLLKDLNSRKRREAALRQLDNTIGPAISLLTENLLTDRDAEARYESARMLGRLCHHSEIKRMLASDTFKTQIIQAFIDALEDSDPKVRQQVQQELKRLGGRRFREFSDIFKGLVGWIKGD